MKDQKVSIIVPIYNEEGAVLVCLQSLNQQTYDNNEIILIDDGSTDQTQKILSDFKTKNKDFKLTILNQNHKGPGIARNLGAKQSSGEILVFVDADMTFEKNFISDLVAPILKGKSIGTFSKNEMVSNSNNIWSVSWNINRNCPKDRMLPKNYPNSAPVFRAILKSEFERVSGFDTTGEYTDDWSLSRKLSIKSTLADGAYYYHSNPQNINEVFKQARWIGKNEFITGSLIRQIKSLVLYSLPLSLIIGLYKAVKNNDIFFIWFKVIYDFAVWISVIKSFFGEEKTK